MRRDQILATPLRLKGIDTVAWGEVLVRELRADELPRLLEILDSPPGAERLAAFCVLGCVEDDGTPLFMPGDEKRLAQKGLEAISKIADAFLELNGLEGIDVEEEKKSPSAPMNTSPTISLIAGTARTLTECSKP